jgi:hypothetical protein
MDEQRDWKITPTEASCRAFVRQEIYIRDWKRSNRETRDGGVGVCYVTQVVSRFIRTFI